MKVGPPNYTYYLTVSQWTMFNISSLPRHWHCVTEDKSITMHFKSTRCHLVVCPERLNQYLRGTVFWKLALFVSTYSKTFDIQRGYVFLMVIHSTLL